MAQESLGRVLVMGLARSGRAATRMLLDKGYEVTVNDLADKDANDSELSDLEERGARLVFGGHPLTLLDDAIRFVVKNPGIPYKVPLVKEALERDIPVYTEIEVASWFAKGPVMAITGSNGKTTTTTLVGEILQSAGLNPLVAGNIGTAFSGVVDSAHAGSPIVLEVSSFQLEGTSKFRPHVAALLNLVPAHLDFHGTFENYSNAKWKIFANQTSDDYAVLNYDQETLRERAQSLASRVFWFTTKGRFEFTGSAPFSGVCVEDGQVVVVDGDTVSRVMPVERIALPGQHNLQNALAATAIAWLAGAREEAIAQVLESFKGVEHRIEYVRTLGGVFYYNDSKSTNPTAALQALKSFPGSIIWIAGGLDRKDDYSVLQDVIAKRVKTAILYGQTKADLANFCTQAGVADVEVVNDLEEAARRAASAAAPGDVVLLSPACASWDMFRSFEERGRMFKEVVHRL